MPLTAPTARLIVPLGLLAAALLATGCGRVFTASGMRFQSIDQGTMLNPPVVSAGYRAEDASTAEFYLSDIPLRELTQAESFEDLSGTIVHIHLFIRPKPGKTPIEPTASSATVQAIVLSRGEVGLYGGGGFMLPSGTPGDDTLGGSIRSGSVRLLAATSGFADRLGAASLSIGLSAPRDEAATGAMAHLFEEAASLARGERSASGG